MAAALLAGCSPRPSSGWQGYLEGEFVSVGAPLAGTLERLLIQKGARVQAGAPLFVLEHARELAAQREAAHRLHSARARLEDMRKGSRPSELAALEARLEQAQASAELTQRERARQEDLFKRGVLAESELDRARVAHQRNRSAVDELHSQLATARLGARPDMIAAAKAEVAAAAAASERADWAVTQKKQAAVADALVHDTLFQEGEFVPAGTPVVVLLPPQNLKVRFFVPEAELAAVEPGALVHVLLSGTAPLEARISYVSPRPEYTPPVLYNRENRAKLVFMVEAVFDPAVARGLHPGQPADVVKTGSTR